MFDVGTGGPDVDTFDPGGEPSPERRQYTLKGVEAETIRLMRYAASKEGMKIGSWVSLRMREAAERALSESCRQKVDIGSVDSNVVADQADLIETIRNLITSFSDYRERTEYKICVLEKEVHEINSSQRTILSAILNKR